jgi:transposase
MATIRSIFSREQKLQIVKESLDEGIEILQLAKQYDVHANTLSRWRREYLQKSEASFPGNGNTTLSEVEKENLKLKKELREAELERDILKKAIRIFSKSDGKFINS